MAKDVQRRRDLIAATVREIGETGTLNVTVGQIARRAGVSPGLAFHYFGDKEALFLASMRSILRDYGRGVAAALRAAGRDPRARLAAIVRASFADNQFEGGAVAAWLNFYVLAQTSEEARRLLTLYHRRLHSNLAHDLRPLVGARTDAVAARLAGQIDGTYLRFALNRRVVDAEPAADQVLATLAEALGDGTA
ncbi:transcriptional regulator BetI [Roseivivax isoporae]|uniref:HTH-type transcriptional regulator BetI n=1 Tax=Roseivivax isoporae LMG 25204 TaxID=1449351 RepID=X7FAJ3_9RHOB|nr:transcriptional regulator BetI [Roseivivax isoporae]ETX29116.1 BetI family transcriptional regulator [Roseivivax isoporae LMG 25204]